MPWHQAVSTQYQVHAPCSGGRADFGVVFPSELASGLTKGRTPEEEAFDHPLFIPARRFGGDEEMAGMILYLASRAGSYCNGMILAADGGRMGVTLASY